MACKYSQKSKHVCDREVGDGWCQRPAYNTEYCLRTWLYNVGTVVGLHCTWCAEHSVVCTAMPSDYSPGCISGAPACSLWLYITNITSIRRRHWKLGYFHTTSYIKWPDLTSLIYTNVIMEKSNIKWLIINTTVDRLV